MLVFNEDVLAIAIVECSTSVISTLCSLAASSVYRAPKTNLLHLAPVVLNIK